MKLSNEQLLTANAMEAAAIGTAMTFLAQFGKDATGRLVLMLAMKVIQDEYPDLYPNVSNAPQLITAWLLEGAPNKFPQRGMFAAAKKRSLNFTTANETKH